MHPGHDPLLTAFQLLSSMLFQVKDESDLNELQIPAAIGVYLDLKRILSSESRGEVINPAVVKAAVHLSSPESSVTEITHESSDSSSSQDDHGGGSLGEQGGSVRATTVNRVIEKSKEDQSSVPSKVREDKIDSTENAQESAPKSKTEAAQEGSVITPDKKTKRKPTEQDKSSIEKTSSNEEEGNLSVTTSLVPKSKTEEGEETKSSKRERIKSKSPKRDGVKRNSSVKGEARKVIPKDGSRRKVISKDGSKRRVIPKDGSRRKVIPKDDSRRKLPDDDSRRKLTDDDNVDNSAKIIPGEGTRKKAPPPKRRSKSFNNETGTAMQRQLPTRSSKSFSEKNQTGALSPNNSSHKRSSVALPRVRRVLKEKSSRRTRSDDATIQSTSPKQEKRTMTPPPTPTLSTVSEKKTASLSPKALKKVTIKAEAKNVETKKALPMEQSTPTPQMVQSTHTVSEGAQAALQFLANSPDFLQALLATSKEYAPAEICFFASCDEGEEDYSVKDSYNRSIFTATFLRMASTARRGKTMSNEHVLAEIASFLPTTGYKAHPMLTTSRSEIAKRKFHIFPQVDPVMNTRRVLVIAIAYTGSNRELSASHNNARSIIRYLKDVEGVPSENMNILMDDFEHELPTKENIEEAFRKLVEDTRSGDAVFVYFTGLGGQVEDEDNDEEDGLDEVMIPYDMDEAGPIVDDDIFAALVSPMPERVQMLCVFDAAHSGTMLELPFKFNLKAGSNTVVAHKARFSRADSARKIRQQEAEDYVPAEVFLFASCDEGESDYSLEDGKKRSIFTSTMLDYCEDVLAGTSKKNNEVLQEVADDLEKKGYKAHPVLASSRAEAMNRTFNLFPENCLGETRALVIGIRYFGQADELSASHNNANSVTAFLKKTHELEDEHITILMDDGKHTEPTKQNILDAFQKLVRLSESGDAIFLYFAGLGGQVEDDDGDEEDGMDELMIPVDVLQAGPIRDDQIFSDFICQLEKGVSMNCMIDASHSGTMLELPNKFTVAQAREGTSSEVVNHGARFSHRQTASKIRNQQFLKNPEAFPERLEKVTAKAEDYAPAEVLLYSSFHDGEKDVDKTDTKTNWPFQMPGAKAHVHGILTQSMLKTMKEVHDGKKLNNDDVLKNLSGSFAEKGVSAHPILTSSRIESRLKPFSVFPESHKGARRALLIGIRYSKFKKQGGEVTECRNNIRLVMEHLLNVEGLPRENITVMMDDYEHDAPTKTSIMSAFGKLVNASNEGDSVFFYYTGHGSLVEDTDGDEEDGFDEVLLPMDFMKKGPLKDDDIFLKFISPMKKGVRMTCILDSSHSGTVLELPFKFTAGGEGKKDVVVSHGGRFPHMTEARAIRKKEKADKEYWAAIAGRGEDAIAKHVDELSEVYAPAVVRLFAAAEDGTQAKETDVDHYFDMPEAGSRTGGMFTSAMIEAMKMAQEGNIETNRDALRYILSTLEEKEFQQKPVLSSSRLYDIDEQFRVIPEGCTGTLRALLIGINYTGHVGSELNGSHEDCKLQYAFLMSQGFLPENVTILMDAKKRTKPTRRNILKSFRTISEASKPGDVIFLHFSGHGGQIEDQDGDEDDGHDETLVPLDVKKEGPIRDDIIFRKLVCTLPKGVTMTACFDCCNSGSILDLPFEFTPDSKPEDLLKGNLNFFPHMGYVQSLRTKDEEELEIEV